MTVVADSTPLISLSAIGRLDLLKALYGTILVPQAVYDEIVTQGTAGVLQQAKLQRLISALKPELDALRRCGFHLSDRVYGACLSAAGE